MTNTVTERTHALKKLLACAVAVSCLLVGPVTQSHAAPPGPNGESQFVFDYAGWDMYPVWSSSDELVGFYAHPNANVTAVPGNIQRVWLERIGTTGWQAVALNPLDKKTITNTVQAAGGDMAIVDAVEENLVSQLTLPISGPTGVMSGGLLLNDPLATLVAASNDPAAAMDALASIGYAAAPALSGQIGTPSGSNFVPAPTRQSLDCLHRVVDPANAPANSNCFPCVCTTHYGTVTPTPPGTWSTTTVTTGDSKTCKYTRDGTAPWWKTGENFFCFSCASGSPTAPNPATDVREVGRITVHVDDPCPAQPPRISVVPR